MVNPYTIRRANIPTPLPFLASPISLLTSSMELDDYYISIFFGSIESSKFLAANGCSSGDEDGEE